GVGQATEPRLGTIWQYEGQTVGYRVLHFYFPRSGTIITLGVNSSTLGRHLGRLAAAVYQTLHRSTLRLRTSRASGSGTAAKAIVACAAGRASLHRRALGPGTADHDRTVVLLGRGDRPPRAAVEPDGKRHREAPAAVRPWMARV